MDPTGNHCMFPCSGSKTQARKQRTGEHGEKGPGASLGKSPASCVCWGDRGSYLVHERRQTAAPGGGGRCLLW